MNLLFICAEELRVNALACYGNSFCPTRHLDALAARGTRFTRHFACHGKCVPSRVGMITGTYPAALGCRDLTTYPGPEHDRNAFAMLKAAGYRTALIGKNHVVRPEHAGVWFEFVPTPGPTFQEYRVANADALPPLRRALCQGRLAQPLEKTRDWLSVDHLASFLNDCGDAPFAAWLNFENSHPPYAAPEPFWSAIDRTRVTPPKRCGFDDKPAFMRLLHETWGVNHLREADLIEIKAAYHAQVLVVDAMVGRVMELLAARGQLDNTLVVFTSDHGDWAGEYGLVEKWDTAFHDDLLHVPLIIAGPGLPAGRVAEALLENVDLFPTILDLLGVRGWDTAQHGRSFADVLAGGADRHRDDVLAMGGLELEACRRPMPLDPRQIYIGKHRCLHADPATLAEARMLRTSDWKIVVRAAGVNELYDLRNDPGELTNRGADPVCAATRAALVERLLIRTITASPRWPPLPAGGVYA